MKIRVPEYFKDFKCIASGCEDTCCAGWGIVIDEETNSKYQKVEGEFGDRLKNEIVHDAGENIFVLKGNNCPFLNENKMCDIYSELGEDSLCYTCRQYPRYIEDFDGLQEMGISLSCPEAARMILRDSKKAEFELSENDETNDLFSDLNEELFKELIECREIVLGILQNHSIDLAKRASVVLQFVNEIQEKIDSEIIEDIKSVKEKYQESDFIEKTIKNLDKYKDNESDKYNNIYEYFKVFKDLRHINPNDPLGLNDALRYFWQSEDDEELYLIKHKQFNDYYKDNMYKFENLLVYFIFRYFMKAMFDYDVSAKIKISIVSFLMIKELAVVRFIENGEFTEEDMVDISHTYSKDIEHLEENIETLEEVFETSEVFEVNKILVTLMN